MNTQLAMDRTQLAARALELACGRAYDDSNAADTAARAQVFFDWLLSATTLENSPA